MKLKLEKRDLTGKKVKSLRQEGKVPASVYGPHRESLNVIVDSKEFNKVFAKSGFNNLVDIEIDGEGDSFALVKEVQKDPIRDEFWHVSLYQVDMNKEIVTDIPLVIEGISPAVKNNLGILMTPVSHLTVRCLPKDIPAEIKIDISGLVEVGNSIKVSDITLPAGVVLAHEEQSRYPLVSIALPQKRVEEEETASTTEAAAEAPAEEEKK